ncbi:response regulator [Neobacillus mesonae]|uniref:response regulator n=1 Tax=Neobacillus mesonae TaxID=1193713 RepID=UPI002E21E6E2|nr:response regulator [Neobacillus mesonae]MED4203695.1 response regulator [Neobacillus mesonae]
MYKLMIVEDESWIRAGLLKYFNWEELGFTSITEAENGQDALEKARIVHPDFILTDIRMPKLDGLQLIELLRQELPDCIFVILSGYEDFTYAKTAIQLGVTAYLIKPLQYEESMKTILECTDKMKARIEERKKQEKLKKSLEESNKLNQERHIKELLEHDFSEEEWQKRCALYQLPLLNQRYLTIVFSCISQPGWDRSFWERAAEELKSLWVQGQNFFPQCHVFSYSSGMTSYFLLAAGESSDLSAYVDAVLERITAQNLPLYCGIGLEVTSYEKIRKSKQLAENAIRYRFFKEGVRIFDASKITGAKGYPFQITENQKMVLINAVEQADHRKIKQLMQQFIDEVRTNEVQATPEKLFAFVQEMIGTCVRFVHKHGIDMKEIYHSKLFSYQILDDFSTIDDLFGWLGNFMYNIGKQYKETPNDTAAMDTRIFSRIESYIIENIDQEITLNAVANLFFYNPAYLSRLFKTKLNKNYTTFISEIRINYAKECLKNPAISVSEVGPMCGYHSYKHFVKTFKKITGHTPTDYRKRLGETG